MAAIHLSLPFLGAFNGHKFRPRITISKNISPLSSGKNKKLICCDHQELTKTSDKSTKRRSANSKPSTWDYDFIQSLSSEYLEEAHIIKLNELKEEVKMILKKETNTLNKLEMVDVLQRLGVSYHFEDEIENLLKSNNHSHTKNIKSRHDLYITALEFRLLRQQGHKVPQDVFNSLKDEQGKFKARICDDIKGLLYLYEASFLSIEGECMLEEIREFAVKNLKAYLEKESDEYISMIVKHALELPFHWRMQRAETIWFITVYENSPNMNLIFLQLAKLDFNIIQATHQQDLKHSTSWWKKTGLGEKLSSVRAGPMEFFLWSEAVFEPEFSYARRMSTRYAALITVLDDIYDIYASLDEIQLFTDAIQRWDMNATDQLPEYMKICFSALDNTVNEIASDILEKKGLDIIPYLRKSWANLCKCYLMEAEWYHNGYIPTLEEYMETAWVSVGVPLALMSAYFVVTNQITNEAMESLKVYPDIIRWSSIISRLANDLETSSNEIKRGDNLKSIQCYMYQTGVSKEEARDHMHDLINQAWKKMNENQMQNTVFPQSFMRMAMNMARIFQWIHAFGALKKEMRSLVSSFLVEPLPLKSRVI